MHRRGFPLRQASGEMSYELFEKLTIFPTLQLIVRFDPSLGKRYQQPELRRALQGIVENIHEFFSVTCCLSLCLAFRKVSCLLIGLTRRHSDSIILFHNICQYYLVQGAVSARM